LIGSSVDDKSVSDLVVTLGEDQVNKWLAIYETLQSSIPDRKQAYLFVRSAFALTVG
jgi:hypothetical protein